MPDARWRPARAGILNVYQYGDETLHFADGRLLLRGVNGSGKSTAMNMLLPFLLEADTRRIDAAGEQTGVLTSWMLADNDETQRTGYLWLEFQRPDDDAPGGVRFHTVGCGIRANRSTNRTTPWWFSTPRRPRIDFALTANKVPLAVDALRAELGADAVFTTTSEYRAEVARRFFGGADPAGYLRLLHQVRNPRVGDRIDAELPDRLREALPPVPEDAVADAAQPLEDLEEHRRNVVALDQTDRALGTVLETYRSYARRVLRAAADRADESVYSARSALQARGRLRTAAEDAAAIERQLAERVRDLDDQHRTVSATLQGVLESDAYKEAAALNARRGEVESLERLAAAAARGLAAAARRVVDAVAAVGTRRGRVDEALAAVATRLTAAARYGRAGGVELPLPAAPTVRIRSRGAVDGPDGDPIAVMDLAPATDAVRTRRAAVGRVRALVAETEQERLAAQQAREVAELAAAEARTAQEEATLARLVAEEAGEEHRTAMSAWAVRWAAHVAAVPAAEPGTVPGWLPAPDLVDPERGELRQMAANRVAAAGDVTEATAAAVEPVTAAATVRVRQSTEHRDAVGADLAAVRSATELSFPRAGWQRPDPPDAELLAALVEFAPDLDAGAAAGLEAACEAVGLLTAAVRDDGAVVTADGELLVLAAAPVTPNLGSLLVSESTTVSRALAAVGVDHGSGAPLWVATDGRFGAGPLRGRHHKETAEHIGAGARERARRRRIAELEEQLRRAERELAAEAGVLGALTVWRDAIRPLNREIPPTGPVDDAAATAAGAAADARRAAERATTAGSVAAARERQAEQVWARTETAAAEHGLPVVEDALTDVAAALAEAAAELRGLPDKVAEVRRAVHDWGEAVDGWERDAAAHDEAAEEAVGTGERAVDARTAFTAAEAALGDTPQQIAAQVADLTRRRKDLRTDLEANRRDHTDAVKAAATAHGQLTGAAADVERAEAVCGARRAALRGVLAVGGLFAAASEAEAPPEVADSVDGTSRLVAAVRDRVPEPVRMVDEDALDRSLRQIRDALGAGWDAGARRAGDGAPAAVEVSGPYGRRALPDAAVQVAADLRRARGLLTAQQDQALRNLLHGRVAREVARSLFEASELVRTMNGILALVTTSQGIGVRLEWRTRGELDPATAIALRLLAKDPDARTEAEDAAVRAAVAGLLEDARATAPEASYRDVIAGVLDYRAWHELKIYLRRPGRPDELLRRRTKLSEGEKKLVTYLPMAAAASAAATAHDPHAVGAPRLILLDDAFAKVSEDNHERLFGLLVDLDLDFVVTSERLFGTHANVPALSIVEVLRDPDLRTIALVHYHWDGRRRTELTSA